MLWRRGPFAKRTSLFDRLGHGLGEHGDEAPMPAFIQDANPARVIEGGDDAC
jgi:hypothetical protein